MNNLDSIIFKDKKFCDLLEEIYINSKTKEKQIAALIAELKPLINDIGDAVLVVPLIKEYMEIGVKNDEQLIKMATIVQRATNNTGSDDNGFGMSDAEKAQLLEEIQKFSTNSSED